MESGTVWSEMTGTVWSEMGGTVWSVIASTSILKIADLYLDAFLAPTFFPFLSLLKYSVFDSFMHNSLYLIVYLKDRHVHGNSN